MTWRQRRSDIDALLPEIAELVTRHLADVEEVCKTRLAKRDAGYLLDLADFALDRVPERAARSFHRLCELRLQTFKDFEAIHTLSEQSSLGTSASASVKIVNCRTLGSSKRVYAVKTITKSSALRFETVWQISIDRLRDEADSVTQQTSLCRERDILREALDSRRQDIVQIVGAAQDDTSLSIVLEYLPAGDIGLVLEERKVIPEAWAKYWIAQIVNALSWLHGVGYAHRDVKPSNILLTLQGNAKLADFGSAAPTIDGYVIKKYTLTPVGTVDYIAPEVLLAHQSAVEEDSLDRTIDIEGRGGYGTAIDWWSLAVSLYEMVSASLPFYAESIPETYEKIIEHRQTLGKERFLRMSSECKNLLQTLLVSAGERPSVLGIQKHPFFGNIDWQNLGRTPGPMKPVIRQLLAKDQSSMHEPASKVFDFSALFSSPGLSFLRPDAGDVTHSFDLRWAGFTILPKSGEFDAHLDDIPAAKLLQQVQSISDKSVAAAFPFTPARRSASPYAITSSNRRNLQNASALKEVVTYGILRTAKKASAATVRREREAKAAPHPDVLDLEKRHQQLLHEINNIEQRYRGLVASTQKYTEL